MVWMVSAVTLAAVPVEPGPDPLPRAMSAVSHAPQAQSALPEQSVPRRVPVALAAASIGVTGAVLAGVLVLLARLWRGRRGGRTWAVAFAASAGPPVVRTIGHGHSLSVRWVTHIGPGIHTLREEMA